MSRQACLRDRWRTEVMRSHLITDSTRVVLLFLASSMAANGYVSVPRSEIAEALNRSPRRVTERIELAQRAGYLDTVTKGRPGRTAEYRACIPPDKMVRPSAPSVTDRPRSTYGAVSSTRVGAPGCTNQLGADGGPANTRARSTYGERSEHLALHNPAGLKDASTESTTAPRCVDRYGTASSTRQAGTVLRCVVGPPPASATARRHNRTAWSRYADRSPRRQAFAFRVAVAS